MAEYIDKNEFFDAIRAEFYDRFPTGSEVISRLLKFPAADVRENVRATVIIDKNENEICSNCGCHLLTMYTVHDRLVLQPSFCPNCGAQMGGAEDGK